MIHQKHCPFCNIPSSNSCPHLALAAEGRDFVRRCVEACQGQAQWQALCQAHRARQRQGAAWSSEQEDFMWLETAFCDKFLKQLTWFRSLDHEWRTGPKLDQGGFWVLLWSKEPQQLWWQLRDEFERQASQLATAVAG